MALQKIVPHPFKNGFTLIELMIVIALVGILAGVAIPSFQSFMVGNRIKTTVSDLKTDFRLARSEAMKNASVVTICSSSDGASCNGSRGSWSVGRIAFLDRNSNRQVDANDSIFLIRDSLSRSDKLDYRGFPSSNYFQYSALGRSNDMNGTFVFCAESVAADKFKGLSINKGGRARETIDGDGDGVQEYFSSGAAIACK
ncbi:GspH/FimT family pseudopilin [Pelagibaculum spongiae]|uniref:Type II secretion system protein H n=1 Tax=Pelagibaculum spongiae TaxID=2080658 RepID=A0A2V1GVD8_9GAMM|nr:GspH/FimT family pseudopilin [Pelagibaculum spongiae]PVZ70298.1 hypothetical protein DC094_06785 [Pelagibaculum spongiae]